MGKTAAYPGALSLVPEDSPARTLWKAYEPPDPIPEETESEEEEASPVNKQAAVYDKHVNSVIQEGIRLRTTAEAYASGIRCARMTRKKDKKTEPFKGVSVYHKLFPGFTIISK